MACADPGEVVVHSQNKRICFAASQEPITVMISLGRNLDVATSVHRLLGGKVVSEPEIAWNDLTPKLRKGK